MNPLTPTLLSLLLISTTSAQYTYPSTKTIDASDTYFGVTYKDPYRWLENLQDKQVEQWFQQQADLTEAALKKIPARQSLVDEWTALDKLKPASYGLITAENGRYFYKKTLGGENVGKFYYRQGLDGPEKLLFDPTTYAKDGKTLLETANPSWDGKHVILALSSGGSEWAELRILDVDTGKLLDDRIYPSWGSDPSNAWTPDNQSFLYDAGNTTDIKSSQIELNRKTRLHKLGIPVSDDFDLFSNESCPQLGISEREMPLALIAEDFPDWIIGNVATVQRESRFYIARTSDLKNRKADWKLAAKLSDNILDLIPQGDFLYARTHTDAPKYKLVRTPVDSPDWSHAQTVLPESDDSLQAIAKCNHYLFGIYSNGVSDHLLKYNFATAKTSDVKLPATGSVLISCPDWKTDICDVVITSWTQPPLRFDYDANSDTFTKSRFDTSVKYPGFENLVAEEVEAPSHDGTMVPLSILHNKNLRLDGSNCCILEGYGAYGFSARPFFHIMYSLAARHGVVLAVAHPRGGGEKGTAWYDAGRKSTKSNTWKDFIACAEYLVRKGYTSPDHLAGTGTSAGGILISRAITTRPDLFRAAVCNVGVANATRAEFSQNGPVNVPEFGTVKDEAECRALFEMDGVQHVTKGVKYPAVMAVAGWNDPRVAPWQPGKFAAALQSASTSGRPVFLKVNYNNGHFTEEKTVTFNNFASQFSFLLWQCGHAEFQPVENGTK
jgi:prolyl oligopeptidase